MLVSLVILMGAPVGSIISSTVMRLVKFNRMDDAEHFSVLSYNLVVEKIQLLSNFLKLDRDL